MSELTEEVNKVLEATREQTTASTELTKEVSGKMAAIDAARDAAINSMNQQVTAAINGIPVEVTNQLEADRPVLQQQVIANAAEATDIAANRAEGALDLIMAAGTIYDTIQDGLDATAVGDFFSTWSSDPNITLVVYKHDTGDVATVIKYLIGTEWVKSKLRQCSNRNVGFSITDQSGRRSWIEADPDGKPTENSISMLNETLRNLKFYLEQEVINNPYTSFSITDENGRRSWIEVDSQGKPTVHSIKILMDVLIPQFDKYVEEIRTDATTYYNPKTDEVLSIVGTKISCIGDSLTAGAGGGGTSYPSVLASLIPDATVINRGVGGESSVTICARMGGNPFKCVFDSTTLTPDLDQNVLVFEDIQGYPTLPLRQGNGGSFEGTLYPAGIKGTIRREGGTTTSGGVYKFDPTDLSEATAINEYQTFVLDYAADDRNNIAVIWIGQNGPSTERAITDAKAIINNMNTLNKQYIVMVKPTSSDADDTAFFNEFGSRMISVREYLSKPVYASDGETITTSCGLRDASIVPTTQDLVDIQNRWVPESLRNDSVHLNAAGYTVLANLVFTKMKELGYLV